MSVRRSPSRVLPWIGVPVAALAAGVMVSTSSYSAFSATTAPPASTWETGTVRLADDSQRTAAFSVAGLAPGDTGEKCITILSSGSLPADVRFFATQHADTNGLGQHIGIAIDSGTGGGSGSCTGFIADTAVYRGSLADLAASHSAFGSGVGSWLTTGGDERRVHRIAYTVSPAAPSSAMGGTATATFAWEAQNR